MPSGLKATAESLRDRRAARDPIGVRRFRFPAEVMLASVRWCLRYILLYRDVEELLAKRGVEVDHVRVYRWVQRFTQLLAEDHNCLLLVSAASGGYSQFGRRSPGRVIVHGFTVGVEGGPEVTVGAVVLALCGRRDAAW